MSEALLRLDQVTTYYGQMRILEGISLHVNAVSYTHLTLPTN